MRSNLTILREKSTGNGTLKVDLTLGVVRGVRVLSPHSRNGRTYLPEALEQVARLAEARPVHIDHGQRAERSIADRIGWLEGCRAVAGGVVANLHLLKSHPMSDRIFEAAERRPSLFGLSMNGEGFTRDGRGGQEVYEVREVHSVDVVADPATTRSLFESLGAIGGDDVNTPYNPTTEELVATLTGQAAPGTAAAFTEAVTGDDMPADYPPEPSATSDTAAQAFKTMIVGVLDDDKLDVPAKVKRIREILTAQEKLAAKLGPTTESLRRGVTFNLPGRDDGFSSPWAPTPAGDLAEWVDRICH